MHHFPLVLWLLIATLFVGATGSDVFAQSGRVSGIVVDASGNPIAGAEVVAEADTGTGNQSLEAITNEQGRFILLGFSSGVWSFSSSLDGYVPGNVMSRVTQGANVDIELVLTKIPHRLVLALGAEAMAGLDPDVVEAELQNAENAFNTEDWDTAITLYHSLLEKIPQMTNLLLIIGNSHRAKGENTAALDTYDRLLASDPNNEQAKTEIARTKLIMGDFEAGSSGLAAAASGLNANREDLYNMGEVEFARGNIDGAEEWYQKASTTDPDWAKPFFKLALVALNRGEIVTAKEFFEKVVALEPDSEEGIQAKATLDALP